MRGKTLGSISSMCAIVIVSVHMPGCGECTTQAASKPYPLDVCIVTGETLGSMGKAINQNHEGQEVKFCCSGCIATFEKDPAKHLVKLTEGASPPEPLGHDDGDHAGHDH